MRLRLLYACLLAAAITTFATPAFANKDIVQFGSTIHIAPDSTAHDVVCFFCSVDNRGTIEGDTVVFFGDVHIAGHSNHDVVNFFGTVRADDDSGIGNSLVSMFGSVRLGENVSVGKDLVAMFGGFSAAPTATIGGDRVVQPAWIFWAPLLIFALIIILAVREYRSYRRRVYLRSYPFPPRQ
jgi:hypothetical protein